MYLLNCRDNAAAMSSALDRSEYETLQLLAHRMKGSGSAYGFPIITELSAAVERAAEAANPVAIRVAIEELSGHIAGLGDPGGVEAE